MTESNHLLSEAEDTPEPFRALVASIEGLSPENQSLLALAAASKVGDLLEHLREHSDGLDTHGKALLVAAGQASSFAGLVASTTHAQHADWNATGDRRVDAVFEQYVKAVARMVVRPEDIPDDVLDRMASGNGTQEDYDLVKSIVAERTGRPADDLEVEVIGKREGSKADDTEAPAPGMYL